MNYFLLSALVFMVLPLDVKSQALKINNGLSISNIQGDNFSILGKSIKTYSIFLGIDYFSKKYYEISSEIGYIKKGGEERELPLNNSLLNIVEKKGYININTTFRGKYPILNSYIYVGVGPKIDFITADNKFESEYFFGYKFSKITYGLKMEVGMNQILRKNLFVGINACNWINFNNIAYSNYMKLKNRSLSIFVTIGYIIQ